jgi:ParB-like chromosome segregation protein Spo0J
MKKEIKFPVLNVKMVDINKVVSNQYNPNKVAPPEMQLLKHSIEMDGYTQPIVAYYDKKKDKYIIVDGFHRYRCAKEYFDLPEIPIVVINKDLKNRMASTIRHNRARGTHQIPDMSRIVANLTQLGWSEDKISKELGMELDETIRLRQVSGLKESFSDHTFSKSWEEFESKTLSDDDYKQYTKKTTTVKSKKSK